MQISGLIREQGWIKEIGNLAFTAAAEIGLEIGPLLRLRRPTYQMGRPSVDECMSKEDASPVR